MIEQDPHQTHPHSITGMTNGRLALWLLLASEVMLFGAFFSTYVMLRLGAPNYWPVRVLNIPSGAVGVLLMVLSSIMMRKAVNELQNSSVLQFQRKLTTSLVLQGLFLANLAADAYRTFAGHGRPAVNNFYALYDLLIGLYAFHVLTVAAICVYLLYQLKSRFALNRALLAEHLKNAALFVQFITVIWILIFGLFYLI